MWKFRTWQGLIVGLGIGIAGGLLYPRLRNRKGKMGRLYAIAGTIRDSFRQAQESVRTWKDDVKEEVEDMVAEAQFERFRRNIAKELEADEAQ